MIKIEKLAGKATFVREGKTTPVFAGQLLNHTEITTLEVLEGSVLYSIDEAELVTATAGGPVVAPVTETKSPENTEPVAATTEVAKEEEVVKETPAVTVAPAIVKPAPRAKK